MLVISYLAKYKCWKKAIKVSNSIMPSESTIFAMKKNLRPLKFSSTPDYTPSKLIYLIATNMSANSFSTEFKSFIIFFYIFALAPFSENRKARYLLYMYSFVQIFFIVGLFIKVGIWLELEDRENN